MNRNEWEFEYTASKVADGAQAQAMFRTGRAEFWESKKAEVMATIRESGIEITESLAASLSNYTSAHHGPQVGIRADLQMKLTECHEKIKAHRKAVQEYEGWVQVLRANPEQRLKLTQGDWLYFFGKV